MSKVFVTVPVGDDITAVPIVDIMAVYYQTQN
jgi:hypothetical protein